MPQESKQNQINSWFISPVKNLRGLKGNLGYNGSNNEASYTEEMFNDRDLAQRKAEEAGTYCSLPSSLPSFYFSHFTSKEYEF